jgi:transcription antitermination factor NusG
MDIANTNWYVFYTRPRSEKVVCNELVKRHYCVFLPLVKTLRRWKNRQNKMVSKVLFPGYIFVKTSASEIFNIEQIPNVVYCVRFSQRPAIVPEKDIRCIEQMLTLGQDVFTDHDFTEGEHVRVIQGPLAGYEGILIRHRGKYRFCVQLKDIKQCACIDIHSSMLEKA